MPGPLMVTETESPAWEEESGTTKFGVWATAALATASKMNRKNFPPRLNVASLPSVLACGYCPESKVPCKVRERTEADSSLTTPELKSVRGSVHSERQLLREVQFSVRGSKSGTPYR